MISNTRLKQFKDDILKDNKMIRGESQQIDKEGITFVKWKDTKGVTIVSTAHGIEPISFVNRWSKVEKKYIEIKCPSVIVNYNKHMGGVDICDQLMEYYRTFRKTKKWTIKMMHHFIDLAVVNSWMEYRVDCKKSKIPKKNILDSLRFKLDIADALISSTTRKRRNDDEVTDDDDVGDVYTYQSKCSPFPSKSKRYDGYEHWPVWDDLKTARHCRLESCKSRTRCYCSKCNVYLCLSKTKQCYTLFHTK